MRCGAITGDIFFRHDLKGHPENSDRLRVALSGLPHGVRRMDPVKAGPGDLESVHRREYIAWLRAISTGSECYLDHNTYICPDSFQVALHAAGSAMAAAAEAIEGRNCFALVRPPGHHAGPDRAQGYCLLNNASIAAARALGSVDRVAIVDWDLHHGNGTQDIFYAMDRVLFCSVHLVHGYPGTGSVSEIGRGPGRGYTLNAPLEPGCTLADYQIVFSEVFCPALEWFRPGLLIVSAGQDALFDDTKGGMRLLPGDYGILTRMLMEATDLPLALVLEGGYGPSHGKAIAAIFRALGGRPVHEEERPFHPRPSTSRIVRVLKNVPG